MTRPIPALFALVVLAALAADCGPARAAEGSLGLLEAVRATMEQNPNVRAQIQQVAVSEAILKQTSARFDPTLSPFVSFRRNRRDVPFEIAPSIYVFPEQRTESTEYGANFITPLRSGLIVTPSVSYSRNTDSFQRLVPPMNVVDARLTLTIPLLKGRGYLAAAGQEMAAREGVDAARLSYRHELSRQAAQAADIYWSYLAALRRLEVMRGAEDRSKRLLNETRALADSDMLPQLEVGKVSAEVASRRAARVEAERELFQARQSLGIIMGIPFEDIGRLPLPANDFVPLETYQTTPFTATGKLLEKALQTRADLHAAFRNQEAQDILARQARVNLRPRADLNLQAGYTGFDFGSQARRYFTPFREHTAGPTLGASINLDLPLRNRAARGQYEQREAELKNAEIQTENLMRAIQSEVSIAVEALRSSALSLEESKISSDLYREVLEKERIKLQLGESTIIDVLQIEDRLTNADLNYISARQRLSSAIIGLRFQTGTLLSEAGDELTISLTDLTTLPNLQNNH
jgi:outer membrane protein